MRLKGLVAVVAALALLGLSVAQAGAWDDAKSSAKKSRDDAAGKVKKAFDDTSKKAKKAFDDTSKKAKKAVDDTATKAKKSAEETSKKAKKAADDASTKAQKAAKDASSKAKKTVAEKTTNAKRDATDAATKATDSWRDAKAKADAATRNAARDLQREDRLGGSSATAASSARYVAAATAALRDEWRSMKAEVSARDSVYGQQASDVLAKEVHRQVKAEYADPQAVGHLEERRGLATEASIAAIKVIPWRNPETGRWETLDAGMRDLVSDSALEGTDLEADPVRAAALLVMEEDYLLHAKLIPGEGGRAYGLLEAMEVGYKPAQTEAAAREVLLAKAAYQRDDAAAMEAHLQTFSSRMQELQPSGPSPLLLLPLGAVVAAGVAGSVVWRRRRSLAARAPPGEPLPPEALPVALEDAFWGAASALDAADATAPAAPAEPEDPGDVPAVA